jgi:hypothetical protein
MVLGYNSEREGESDIERARGTKKKNQRSGGIVGLFCAFSNIDRPLV